MTRQKLLAAVATQLFLLLLLPWCDYATLASYATPEDCRWDDDVGGDGGVFLTCRLSSINSRLERTNFSVIPAEGTRGLRVICASVEGVATSISHLEPGGFASLHQLQELLIENCALERLPLGAFAGLNRLRRLVVRQTAADAGGAGVSSQLILEAGVLADFSASLQQLDLSANGLGSLPAGELCQLQQLQQLNLSHNTLSTWDDDVRGATGTSGSDVRECQLPHLLSLDLSDNQLTSFNLARWSTVAPLLEELRLSGNNLRHVKATSAEIGNNTSSSRLRHLDLSNNQLSQLPAGLLHSLPQLEQLLLSHNHLSLLPQLPSASMLSQLALAGNVISQMPANLSQLTTLVELNLANNRMTAVSLSNGSLPGSLRRLRLSGNQLHNITWPVTAANSSTGIIGRLTELDLADNRLEELGPDSLTGLPSLTHLNLAHNRLSTVHAAAFRSAASLLVLDLSGNRLQDVPAALRHLSGLQTLDLGGNLIGDVNAGSEASPLAALQALWRLQLHNNRIVSLSTQDFASLTSLQVLDLSGNRLTAIEPGTFDQNRAMRALRLDGNQLSELDSGVLTHLPQLAWLNVSANRLAHFDYALVPRTLTWLDLSHNQLTALGNYFDLGHEDNMALAYLNVGFNLLHTIGPSDLPDRLETVMLNDNRISTVAAYTFFNKAGLSRVDLSVNNIGSMVPAALRLSPSLSTLPSLLLGGNPIVCGCDMQWLKTVNENTNSVQRYPLVADLESIYCRLVYTQEQTFVPLVEAHSDQFLCSYQTHCFSLCQCCQFDSCDCEMTCPAGCTCYHDNSWTKNIIQCSGSQMYVIPDSIPMDATEVFLDGNRLAVLKSHTFIGRKNLRSIHLNSSNIENIENQTFNGLKALTVLHLENNSLRALHGYEFNGLSQLKELYLQGNQISSIRNTTFRALKNLEILFLQENLITNFPLWQLAANPYLASIRLAGNLWSCDCDFLGPLANWLEAASSKLTDADQISCYSPNGTLTSSIAAASSCGSSQSTAVAKSQVRAWDPEEDNENSSSSYLPLMIALLASFGVLSLLALVTFLYRHSLRVWIHARTGLRVFNSLEAGQQHQQPLEAGNSRTTLLFDAYISYSPGDEVFARQVLAHEMEVMQRYRVCLHHRDFPPPPSLSSQAVSSGVGEIVMRAAEAAHRTVILLSPNYLATEWSRYDYKSGLLQAVNRNGGRKVVFILIGNGGWETSSLDPSLRLLLKNNIVLSWGEPLFWEKLRYSLPDPEKRKATAAPQTAKRQQQRRDTSPILAESSVVAATTAAYYNEALHM